MSFASLKTGTIVKVLMSLSMSTNEHPEEFSEAAWDSAGQATITSARRVNGRSHYGVRLQDGSIEGDMDESHVRVASALVGAHAPVAALAGASSAPRVQPSRLSAAARVRRGPSVAEARGFTRHAHLPSYPSASLALSRSSRAGRHGPLLQRVRSQNQPVASTAGSVASRTTRDQRTRWLLPWAAVPLLVVSHTGCALGCDFCARTPFYSPGPGDAILAIGQRVDVRAPQTAEASVTDSGWGASEPGMITGVCNGRRPRYDVAFAGHREEVGVADYRIRAAVAFSGLPPASSAALACTPSGPRAPSAEEVSFGLDRFPAPTEVHKGVLDCRIAALTWDLPCARRHVRRPSWRSNSGCVEVARGGAWFIRMCLPCTYSCRRALKRRTCCNTEALLSKLIHASASSSKALAPSNVRGGLARLAAAQLESRSFCPLQFALTSRAATSVSGDATPCSWLSSWLDVTDPCPWLSSCRRRGSLVPGRALLLCVQWPPEHPAG